MMRVLMLATSFPSDKTDWRGRFIFKMAESLARLDAVKLSLWAPPGTLPDGVQSVLLPDESTWLERLSRAGGIAHRLRRRPLNGLWEGWRLLIALREASIRSSPSIYHCNWMQTALALPDDGVPALVTVLGSDFRMLRLPGMVWALRRAYARRAIVLAPNAQWMVPELTRLFGDVARIKAIPFGVGSEWLSIKRTPSVIHEWIAVIRLTRAKLGDLLDWGGGLFGSGSGRVLHLFGPMQESIDLPDWVVWHGPAAPGILQKEWFSRATGMITLSRHAEGRPQVLLEAMAAGLPILASRIPAHVDFIRHGETGLLCDSAEELANGLKVLEQPDENARLGEAARRWCRDEIGDWAVCARRYFREYEFLGGNMESVE